MVRPGKGWILAAALALCGASTPAARPAPKKERPIRPNVLVLIYDPVIQSAGSKRLHQVCGWKDPHALTEAYIADLEECSGGFLRYRLKEERVVDAFPRKKDGFTYTEEEYLRCFREKKGWHQPDRIDYAAMIRQFDLARRVNRHEVDEVWVWGPPYSGLYESTMAGKDAYFCNSPPLTEVDSDRTFILMGFNYERGVGEMLEDMGHRTEGILSHVYGGWDHNETTAWNRFGLYDKVAPGRAGVGTVHFAPNSAKDYDWGSKKPVLSSADDWLNYPRLTGKRRMVTSADWGGGDIRLHHKWWLSHLPRAPGRAKDGKLANWWKYAVDFGRYEESR